MPGSPCSPFSERRLLLSLLVISLSWTFHLLCLFIIVKNLPYSCSLWIFHSFPAAGTGSLQFLSQYLWFWLLMPLRNLGMFEHKGCVMILPGHFCMMAFKTSSLLELIWCPSSVSSLEVIYSKLWLISLFFQTATLEQPFHFGSGLSIKLLLCWGAQLGKSL